MSRYLAALAACTSFLLAPVWASASVADAATSVNPAAAANQCAGSHGLHASLGKAAPGYLASFVTCVLRAERGQLGLPYTQNRVASQATATALRQFVGLSYLLENEPQAATRAEDLAASNAREAICQGKHGVSEDAWAFADTQPAPAATPLAVAKLLGAELEPAGAVARASGTVFGVATRRGLLFERGNLHGTSLGMIAVLCP